MSARLGQEGLVRPGFLEGSGHMPWASENCTIKGNLRLPDVTLCAIWTQYHGSWQTPLSTRGAHHAPQVYDQTHIYRHE